MTRTVAWSINSSLSSHALLHMLPDSFSAITCLSQSAWKSSWRQKRKKLAASDVVGHSFGAELFCSMHQFHFMGLQDFENLRL